MKFTSYWLDTAPKGRMERSLTTVEGRTEVAVIGGGLTGVVGEVRALPGTVRRAFGNVAVVAAVQQDDVDRLGPQ